jgi:hypothetical protein
VSEQKTEMEMFIEYADQKYNYHVLDFFYKSWIPIKAEILKKYQEKKYE